MGFLTGLFWPAMFLLTAKWISPNERSRFMLCTEGVTLGTLFASFVGGLVISKCGWSWYFYSLGSLGLFWSATWFYLVYDSPQQHPRISDEEKGEIEKEINNVQVGINKRIPWKKILMSGPVWAIIAAQVAIYLTYMILTIEMPSYMDQIFHLDVKYIGLYSSISYGCKILTAIIFAFAIDSLVKTKWLSITSIRKIFGTVAQLFPAVLMVVVALFGENFTISLTVFILSVCLYSGIISVDVNILDIAPNFSGTISGIGSIFSTETMGMFLEKGQTFDHWSQMFWLLFGVNMCGFLIYIGWCSGKLQTWNQIDDDVEATN